MIAAVACGPELTEPASTNVTGRWTSDDMIGPLSEMVMDLGQGTDGVVDGQWSGVSSTANPECPPELGLAPTGSVTGSNTVLELKLALLGAGDFNGQVRDETTLAGSFTSCGLIYSMTFIRVGIAP